MWKRKIRHWPHKVYGLDMSLASPGLCCLDGQAKVITLYWLKSRQYETLYNRQFVRDPASPFCGWMVESIGIATGHLKFTQGEQESKHDFRYRRLLVQIPQLLKMIPAGSVVGIENYIPPKVPPKNQKKFGRYQSPSGEILHEVGGLLRTYLYSHGCTLSFYRPSEPKKKLAGKGNASKLDMYQAYQQFLPDPVLLVGTKSSAQNPVPNPVEDVVDAFAVALMLVR